MNIGKLGLGGLFSSISKGVSKPKLGQVTSALLTPKTSSAAFTVKLEKHLDDFNKGKAYLSKGVSAELQSKNNQINQQLRDLDPAALTRYNEYATAFGYNSKARYVNSVTDVSNTVTRIDQAQKDGEKLKAELDVLVEEYEKKKAEQKNPEPKVDVVV